MKNRWIPKGSEEITLDGVPAVVYLYESGRAAIAYGGKRSKSDFHYSFPNEAAARKYALDYLNGQKETADRKRAEAKARKEFWTSLQAGSILYTSWGYEQTNVEWFQVVEVKPSGKTVVIREIAGTLENSEGCAPMSGMTMPVKGKFIGEPMTKRPRTYGSRQGEAIRIDDVRTAWEWKGQKKYCSWYH